MPQFIQMILASGAINVVYGVVFWGIIVILLWQWFKTGKLFVNGIVSIPFLLLCIFGCSYVLLGELNIQGILYYFICPIFAYLIGWVMVEPYCNSDAYKIIKKTIVFILAGFAIHAFLNYYTNIGHMRWELNDYFTGSIRQATGSGCLNTMIFSLLAYTIAVEKDKKLKFLNFTFFIISFLYAMLLGTRTQFIILLSVNFCFLLFYLKEIYGFKSVAVFTSIAISLIGSLWIVYEFDIIGMRSFVDSSNLMARYQDGSGIEGADEYRINSIARGLYLMLEYPWGGLKDTSYYHNMWLDIGRIAGILPFMLYLGYTFIINTHAWRLFRSRENSVEFRYLIFCIYLGVQVNFLVEPILEGFLDYFLIFLIINGMMECYYYRSSR